MLFSYPVLIGEVFYHLYPYVMKRTTRAGKRGGAYPIATGVTDVCFLHICIPALAFECIGPMEPYASTKHGSGPYTLSTLAVLDVSSAR